SRGGGANSTKALDFFQHLHYSTSNILTAFAQITTISVIYRPDKIKPMNLIKKLAMHPILWNNPL
ncbi:hypothetical protein CWB94_22655, partial [Pseudoalteromonas piscicida]